MEANKGIEFATALLVASGVEDEKAATTARAIV